MPVFIEFLLVALALFLWESTLWFPLRGVVLRKAWFGGGWRVLDPRSIFATRELGLVPLSPLPPDRGLAPCQAPPLTAVGDGTWLVETAGGLVVHRKPLDWDDLSETSHHLVIAGIRVRLISHRCVGALRRARKRGLSLEEAARRCWRLALSPGRAGHEWKRWSLAAGPLHWYGMLLTLGFFAGLPLVYVFKGGASALLLALWLWCLMAAAAARLWWLGNRVYPDARAALRMDALLALLVPFHAMRAFEIAAVHAMATTHPAALLLWAGDSGNPWLARFVRQLLHPSPNRENELLASRSLLPVVGRALGRHGIQAADYDHEPDRADDPQARRYCPRCHGLFLEQVTECPDCAGVALRVLGGGTAD